MWSQAQWAIPTAVAVPRAEVRAFAAANFNAAYRGNSSTTTESVALALCTGSTTARRHFGQGEARYAH